MKKMLAAVLLSLLFSIASFAADPVAAWSRIVGVITSPGVSNPVAGIASGTLPWTTSDGSAIVDSTGGVAFSVAGLVLVGGDASGTPGPVTSVKGTLVCNPGLSGQVVIDTPAVLLSAQGNAQFVGSLTSAVPASCTNPLFLIRAVPKNIWIATGAVRVTAP